MTGCGSSIDVPGSTDAKISKAEFEQIQTGMTLAEVEAIVGGPAAETSAVEVEGIKQTGYQYTGEGDVGANAQLSFDGEGKLITKAATLLK